MRHRPVVARAITSRGAIVGREFTRQWRIRIRAYATVGRAAVSIKGGIDHSQPECALRPVLPDMRWWANGKLISLVSGRWSIEDLSNQPLAICPVWVCAGTEASSHKGVVVRAATT